MTLKPSIYLGQIHSEDVMALFQALENVRIFQRNSGETRKVDGDLFYYTDRDCFTLRVFIYEQIC